MRTLALLLCLVAGQAWATDKYCSTTGVSSGSCLTTGTACSLSRCISTAGGVGDKLILMPGTYTLGINQNTNGTGTADANRVIYEAYGYVAGQNNGDVIIDGLAGSFTDRTIAADSNYTSYRGLTIVVQEVAGTGNRYGIRSENANTGIEVTDCDIYYKTTSAALAATTQQWGIYIQGPLFSLTRNTIHHVNTGINVNTDTGIPSGTVSYNTIYDLTPGDAEDADCINVGSTARDLAYAVSIFNNTCRGYRDDGIDLFGASKAYLYNNTIGDPIDDTQTSNSCIKAGKDTGTGNRITSNKCIHTQAHGGINEYGLVINGLSSGFIAGNIFKVNLVGIQNAQYLAGGGTNNVIVNNTAIGANGYGISIDSSSSATLQNNYMEGGIKDMNIAGTVAAGGHNNLLSGTSTVSGSYTGTDQSGSGGFVGGTSPTTAPGFKLKAGSALLRAGSELNIGNVQDAGNRAFSHPPSIGAWEAASGDLAAERTLR